MTTGSYGPASPGPYDTNTSLLRRRVWSGGDGKYTTFAGSTRAKWNNFTCTYEEWLRSSVSFRFNWWQQAHLPDDGAINVISDDWYLPGFSWDSADVWTSNDDLVLLGRLLKKVKSHDFNLAVNLGQLHQTVDLLAGNLQKLGRAALALKRGNFATAARQLGASPRGTRLKTTDVSGRWLELQYGWLPLLGDSFEAAKAFEAISVGPRSQTYRASYKKPVRQRNGSQSKTYFDMPYKEFHSKYIQYECTEEIGFSRQLGLLDPLSVAWELLPWSFVIDWFIPIGSYLDLINQIPSLKGRFLTTEVLNRQAFSGKPAATAKFFQDKNLTWSGFHYLSTKERPSLHQKRVDVTRTYSEALSVPLPSMHLGGAVHGSRIWNAISLAQQRFARTFR